jgi:glycosyltransferase involved in cell wall biosynthesis
LHESRDSSPAPRGKHPVVVHAPSDPALKGTTKIESAVAALAARTPLDFRLVRGVPNDAVLAQLAAADVVIDQLDSVNVGVVALEAMRLGKPVVSQLGREALAPYQGALPVVPATPETLETELETLLADSERRRMLGEQGRRYVEDVHAPGAVASATLRVYEAARDGAEGLFQASPTGIVRLDDEAARLRRRLAEVTGTSRPLG